MSYTPEIWVDRNVATPTKYTVTDNGDGTSNLVPAPGAVTEAGTTVTAARMNNIEAGLVSAHAMTNIYVYRNLGGAL